MVYASCLVAFTRPIEIDICGSLMLSWAVAVCQGMDFMELGDTVEIKSLTHKTKNRVASWGRCWVVVGMAGDRVQLQQAFPRTPTTTYCFWGRLGIDFEITSLHVRGPAAP